MKMHEMLSSSMSIMGGKRRGTTILESVTAVAAFSGVAAFTVALLVISAKQSSRTVETLPADMQTFRMVDQVRERAFSAQGGRYSIQDNGKTVVFNNPSVSLSNQSRLYFTGNALYFEEVANSNPQMLAIARKMTDASFEIEPDGRSIRVTIEYETKNTKNQVVTATREEIIRARN